MKIGDDEELLRKKSAILNPIQSTLAITDTLGVCNGESW